MRLMPDSPARQDRSSRATTTCGGTSVGSRHAAARGSRPAQGADGQAEAWRDDPGCRAARILRAPGPAPAHHMPVGQPREHRHAGRDPAKRGCARQATATTKADAEAR